MSLHTSLLIDYSCRGPKRWGGGEEKKDEAWLEGEDVRGFAHTNRNLIFFIPAFIRICVFCLSLFSPSFPLLLSSFILHILTLSSKHTPPLFILPIISFLTLFLYFSAADVIIMIFNHVTHTGKYVALPLSSSLRYIWMSCRFCTFLPCGSTKYVCKCSLPKPADWSGANILLENPFQIPSPRVL